MVGSGQQGLGRSQAGSRLVNQPRLSAIRFLACTPNHRTLPVEDPLENCNPPAIVWGRIRAQGRGHARSRGGIHSTTQALGDRCCIRSLAAWHRLEFQTHISDMRVKGFQSRTPAPALLRARSWVSLAARIWGFVLCCGIARRRGFGAARASTSLLPPRKGEGVCWLQAGAAGEYRCGRDDRGSYLSNVRGRPAIPAAPACVCPLAFGRGGGPL